MRSSSLNLAGFVALAAMAFVPLASAQNLLTNNAGFEANNAYYTPGWGWPQGTPDVLPGWVITLDPAGNGYAGAAGDQSPGNLEGSSFGYIYSGSGSSGVLETAPGSCAPVQAGTAYRLWFRARGDVSWSDSLATVSLVWYAGASDPATVGNPTNLDLTLPAILSKADPMQAFGLGAVAPAGANYAGVRITRPAYDYAPILLDDFVIMAEPAEVSLSIKKLELGALIYWPRTPKHRLEVNSNPADPGGWRETDRPVDGVGATNYVEYPFTPSACFFRLAAPQD